MRKFLFALFAAGLATCRAAAPGDCSALLAGICLERGIPALAAAVVDEGEIVALGATGNRCVGTDSPVAIDDKWAVASCTKSMTASVAAMLVEDGTLSWNSTIGEVLGTDYPEMDLDWRQVSLEQLLQHLGGAPHDPPAGLWKVAKARKGSPKEQRFKFVRDLLKTDPVHPPGSRWVYSDCGYAIAGVMMERASDFTWEVLLKERLFAPLGMDSAGFGPPASKNSFDQPWGHLGYWPPFHPVTPGSKGDNPVAIAPAAAVHCSMADLARYAAWHLEGEHGRGWLLSEASFHKLHTPPACEEYAMGWAVTKRGWAGGTALMHNGDNDMFYSEMWLGLRENTAFLVATNASSRGAHAACQAAIRRLINAY
jgi:CubicO group peptidase (beta-lactamase class C family)